jgi:hypothetical protein
MDYPYKLQSAITDDGVSTYAVEFTVLTNEAPNPVRSVRAEYMCNGSRCSCEYDNVEIERNGLHYRLPLSRLNAKLAKIRSLDPKPTLTDFMLTVFLNEDVSDPSITANVTPLKI